MLTLYYSPGACSMAPHIALEETGTEYGAELVLLRTKQNLTEDYRRINPRTRVPALKLDDGSILTENLAILSYIARRFPDAKLMPTEAEAEAKCLSLMSFFSSSVHVAYGHYAKPARYASDESAFEMIKASAVTSYHGFMKEIDAMLAGREWFFDRYSVCDPYALVFYRWGLRAGLPMTELTAYTAHKDRIVQRPAVSRVLAKEEITIS